MRTTTPATTRRPGNWLGSCRALSMSGVTKTGITATRDTALTTAASMPTTASGLRGHSRRAAVTLSGGRYGTQPRAVADGADERFRRARSWHRLAQPEPAPLEAGV